MASWVLGAAAFGRPGLGVTHVLKTWHAHPEFTWMSYIAGVALKGGGEVAADLVVDASGRHSKLPRWLRAVGRAPARELEVDAGIAYSTRIYQLPESVRARPGPAHVALQNVVLFTQCSGLRQVGVCLV